MIKMGKWREEEVTLKCGCKVGRSKLGLWFYDYICDKHVPNVQVDGKFNYEKSLKFTEELQKLMKYRKELADVNPTLLELSPTEMLAYEFIRDAKQPLAIHDMPHQLQGAVGKLLSKELVERGRIQVEIVKHGFTSMKMTNCIKIREAEERQPTKSGYGVDVVLK